MLHTIICFPFHCTYNLSFSPIPPHRFKVPCIPPLVESLGLISLPIEHHARYALLYLPVAMCAFQRPTTKGFLLTSLRHTFVAAYRSTTDIVWVDPYGRWLSSHLYTSCDALSKPYLIFQLSNYVPWTGIEPATSCLKGKHPVPAETTRAYFVTYSVPDSNRCSLA